MNHMLAVWFRASPFISLDLFLSNKNCLTTPPMVERNPDMSKLERPLDTNCSILPKGKLKSREVNRVPQVQVPGRLAVSTTLLSTPCYSTHAQQILILVFTVGALQVFP